MKHALGRTCLWFLCAALILEAGVTGSSQQKIFSETGIALTPPNFPHHSVQDVEKMFKLGKEVGSIAVFIYQWSQVGSENVAREMIRMSNQEGLVPIIAISPTSLQGLRGDLDAPEQVKRAAGRNLSFANKAVYQPYIDQVVRIAQLKPPYLCLATEINLLAFKDIKEYVVFAHIYRKVYPLIKKISPSTQVFVSFQWDYFRLLDTKEPDHISEHSKLIDIFRPELDLVAFTSYPADQFSNPTDVPKDYYEGIYEHIKRTDPVMFMEIGWPSTGKGSEAKQLEFIHRLPLLMSNVKPKILAWSLLHDVGSGTLGSDLATTGLADNRGRAKPAFDAFRELQGK
jgi:hypothetical protein